MAVSKNKNANNRRYRARLKLDTEKLARLQVYARQYQAAYRLRKTATPEAAAAFKESQRRAQQKRRQNPAVRTMEAQKAKERYWRKKEEQHQ